MGVSFGGVRVLPEHALDFLATLPQTNMEAHIAPFDRTAVFVGPMLVFRMSFGCVFFLGSQSVYIYIYIFIYTYTHRI